MEELWQPFDRAGQPEHQWPEMTESIERLHPIAVESLLAVFRQALAVEVEEAFGKALEAQGKAQGLKIPTRPRPSARATVADSAERP
jgi:hypothetical protein